MITINIHRIDQPELAFQICLDGKLHIENVVQFEEKVIELIEENARHLLIDMDKLKYIDSSGIGSLIKIMNLARNKDARLVLFGLNPDILRIFQIASLERFFTILEKDTAREEYPDIKD